MCCCCGLNYCLSWLCISIVTSFIVLGFVGGFQIGVGGPFPTHNWERNYRLVYAGNSVFILTCAGALLALRPYGRTLLGFSPLPRAGIFILINTGLIFPLCVHVYVLRAFHVEVSLNEISTYTREYYDKYDEPPMTIQWLEKFSSGIKLQPNLALECCGATGYEDYLNTLPRCNLSKPRNFSLQFEGSTSCCTSRRSIDSFCASNLQVFEYELKSQFWNNFLKAIIKTTEIDVEELLFEESEKFLDELMITIQWLKEGKYDTKFPTIYPQYDCPNPALEVLLGLIPNWDQLHNTSTSTDNSLDVIWMSKYPEAQNNLVKLLQKNNGINVIGCAKLGMLAWEDREGGIFQQYLDAELGIHNVTHVIRVILVIITVIGSIKGFCDLMSFIWFNFYYIHYLTCCNVTKEMEETQRILMEKRKHSPWQLAADRRYYPSSAKF